MHARLRDAGDPIGLSTVYRAVQSLADDGELDSLRTDSGEALYRRCSPQHHHHLVCRGCGRTVEVAGPAVERWADRIAGEHGFADVSHTLEIFGTCAACRGTVQVRTPIRRACRRSGRPPDRAAQKKSQTVRSGST